MASDPVDYYGYLHVGQSARFRVRKTTDSSLSVRIGEDFTIYVDDVETLDRLIDILEQSKAAFGPDAPERFTRESPVSWQMQNTAEHEDRERETSRMIAA